MVKLYVYILSAKCDSWNGKRHQNHSIHRQMQTVCKSGCSDQLTLLSLCGCYEGTTSEAKVAEIYSNLFNDRKPLVLCEFLLDLHYFLLMLCILVTNLHKHVMLYTPVTGKGDNGKFTSVAMVVKQTADNNDRKTLPSIKMCSCS